MKQGRSLTELAVELERQKQVKKDYLLDTRKMTMDAVSDGIQITLQNDQTGQSIILGVNEVFHDQVGSALKIPAPYYDKMRAENPGLLAVNVNSWFNLNPSRQMVRTLDGTARAFLSDRYRRIDNWDVAQATLGTLMDIVTDLRVESCEVTDQRMYIKVVNPRIQTDVVPGDTVQSGMIISNSEVGRGSLSIQPLVYRLVCTNGMVVNDAAERKYHVGRRNEANEDFTLYSDQTRMLEDQTLLSKIQDTVKAVADQTRFDRVVQMMRDATGVKIETTKIPEMVELTGSEFGFTKTEGEGILNHLIREGDLSLYGLSNAVTRAAQDVESYDRSTELESIGYSILGMSKDKWNRLNAMATAGKV